MERRTRVNRIELVIAGFRLEHLKEVVTGDRLMVVFSFLSRSETLPKEKEQKETAAIRRQNRINDVLAFSRVGLNDEAIPSVSVPGSTAA